MRKKINVNRTYQSKTVVYQLTKLGMPKFHYHFVDKFITNKSNEPNGIQTTSKCIDLRINRPKKRYEKRLRKEMEGQYIAALKCHGRISK